MKRILTLLLITVFISSTFIGCGSKEQTNSSKEKTTLESKKEFKGEITFFAQAYNPVEVSETNPNPPTMFKKVAEEYEKLNPGVKINFILSSGGDDYSAWLKTKIAGGTAPDIFWSQWMDLNTAVIPKGAVVNVNDYLEMPNKYVESNEKWKELFYESILAQTAGPNGEHYNIVGDYVATAMVYNKELYKKAGIDKLPTSWGEFLDASQKLLDNGVIPWAFPLGNDNGSKDSSTWLSRLFLTNFYADDFEKLAVDGSEISLSNLEVAVAVKNGYFSPEDPRWLGWWKLIKDQDKYFPKDYLSSAMDATAIQNMFINGEIATIFDGSWASNVLEDANVDFEYGMYPNPVPTPDDSTLATNYKSAGAIGGPNAAFQYAISTKKANNTMTKEKENQCIDWLMYITTPENNGAIVNDLGSFVPLVKNAPMNGNEDLVNIFESKALSIEGGTLMISANFLDFYYRTYQQYLAGDITLEEAGELIKPILEKEINNKIKKDNLDVEKYIN